MNHQEIQAIYDDLNLFVTQKKWPVNAVLIGKLQGIHQSLRRALNLPYESPPKRVSQFGKSAAGSASKAIEREQRPSISFDSSHDEKTKDDSRFMLQVETPERNTEDSDDDVPDLEQFLYQEDANKINLKGPTSHANNNRSTATMTSPEITHRSASAALQNSNTESAPNNNIRNTGQPRHVSTKQCVVLADSAFRIISGYLTSAYDKAANTRTNFMCHSIGSATISSLALAVHDGLPITSADEVIVHVGVNDVGVRHDRPAPATLKNEYSRLIRKIRDKFPRAKIILSHIFPIKTGDIEARRAVQIGNTAMDAAATEFKDTNVVTHNFGKGLLNGSRLRAHFYDNGRHLNAEGGKFLSYHIREYYGLEVKTTNQQRTTNQTQGRPNPWLQNRNVKQNQNHFMAANTGPQPRPHRPSNPWHQNRKPNQNNFIASTAPQHHTNDIRYNQSQYNYDSPRVDDRRSTQPWPPLKEAMTQPPRDVDMLEKTLHDFSSRLLDLFKAR
jgi:hypothetical protein